jgi:oxygen-independent coproporphyrinogen-3 oxidase
VLPNEISSHATLIQGFKKEWAQILPLLENKKIVSIYFGGGTPSLLGPKALGEILSWIPFEEGTEITLEANPDLVTLELMQQFKHVGINRVSLGLQSLDNPLLKTLGRTHSAQKAIESVHLTNKAGIQNITIDLMYDLPGQTLSIWQKTLLAVKSLPITHLSLYNLTFEEGAVFFKKKKELSPLLPSPEESLQMLESAICTMEEIGLHRYEISAFAKSGFESRHNTGYWTARPFLGLGPSAFSFWEGKRFRNVCHLNKYLQQLDQNQLPRDFTEKLSPLASLHEKLAVRLRMLKGAPREEFPVDLALLSQLESKGWIHLSPTTIQLTQQGLLFYDSVAEEIIISNH